MLLLASVHSHIQQSMMQAAKSISCPTCRKRVPTTEMAIIQSAKHSPGDEAGPSSSAQSREAEEGAIIVEGSFGTKVWLYLAL